MIKTNANQGRLQSVENQVDWTPVSQQSANFATHILSKNGPYQLRSQKTLFYIIFLLLFLAVGSGMLWFLIYGDPVYRNGAAPFSGADDWGDAFCFFLSIAFIVVSVSCFSLEKTKVIDKSLDAVYTQMAWSKQREHLCALNEVTAIQLLQRVQVDSDGDYWVYELNLVLGDWRRVNVLVHGGEPAMTRDAKKLAQFLGCPLLSRIKT